MVTQIELGDITVDVVFKDIKNLIFPFDAFIQC